MIAPSSDARFGAKPAFIFSTIAWRKA